ncbi:MAG: glycosyltransferase family 4 protein [Saprospiraceae bacterium]|nr:glycosyltransferase family 4 protein [Saprospiraceae bacterium]
MRILFLTDNFFPEMNAPANRTYEHCREWVKKGQEVTVLTCVPNFPAGKVFPGYKNKLYQTEWIDGIRVIRIWSYITANEGTIKRILDYTSYAIMAFFASFFIKCDLIIGTSPQFFTAVTSSMISLIKRKPWIMEVRDIWPESIMAVGAMKKNFGIRMLEKIEISLYKNASKIIVVTDAFKQNIIDKGIEPNKIFIIKNGVNVLQFKPLEKNPTIIKHLNLVDKIVIGYFGTHGMAHKLDFILNCTPLVENNNIHFLFIGDGAERDNLVKQVGDLKLKNVTMLNSVPKEEIQNYISIIDIALVNLKRSDTFKSVIPSKIFENAAMHKPILLGVDGESRELIEKYKAGIYFQPEDQPDFLLKLNQIIKLDSENAFEVGCDNLCKDFDRVNLANKMLNIIINN